MARIHYRHRAKVNTFAILVAIISTIHILMITQINIAKGESSPDVDLVHAVVILAVNAIAAVCVAALRAPGEPGAE